MKWTKCSREGKWIPLNESFMDTIKSGWKNIKISLASRPQVKLVGDDGKEEVGHVHDYDRKNKTCSVILAEKFNENVAAIAGAVGGATAANHDDYDYEPKKRHVQ